MKKKGCFIVTATMGSQNNLIVTEMQYFRDQYLLKLLLGKTYNKILL